MKWFRMFLCCVLGVAATAYGGDLSFSDPANALPAPAWAVGQADRRPDLDVLPAFRKPPAGFGVVPFYWWLGDPLTRPRLAWQLEQMRSMTVSGYQINYAHSDRGGRSYGLTYPSDPPLFSEEWWKLTAWFMQEAKKQDASISLSDYTLGFGQGWYVDEVLKENPDLNGATLAHASRTIEGGATLDWDLPAEALAVTAYPLDENRMIGKSAVDLRERVVSGRLRWDAPPGRWRVFAVWRKVAPWSLDPMNAKTGPKIIEKFFQRFEDRAPGEGGRGLNFFFSDELEFGVGGNLWTGRFAEEFRRRKGYDLVPELPALFADVGPRTPKVRLDYRDVLASLSEEGYFRPLFDWHQRRGMTYGCDHGGRGRNVVEFGDYFRTQRWMQGPGSDQPHLSKDLIKAKVASSIAHLYQRPRVWLEGFYGSGWGTTSAGLVDATFANFVMGYNLLSLHGMYYSTHGGWWEWAPPDNTFRMPYWRHLGPFSDCVQRLSYVLSQGHHRCDVAIVYPVAAMEAGIDGPAAVHTAFETGQRLYSRGVDFDFIDFESVARAKVVGKELHVSGEAYRLLVLPAMRAVRHSTLEKAIEFRRAGGRVIALGALPEASDRIGRDDPELAAMVRELFPAGPAKDVFQDLPDRDYDGPGCIMHRKLGARDLYAVYNAPKDVECTFRATGKVELWDPWTGEVRPLAVISQEAGRTRLKLPLTATEIQLIVFSDGKPAVAGPAVEQAEASIAMDGPWEFELQPTCDNRFGDFHWPPTPAMIGPEVRQLGYCEGERPGNRWQKVTCSFGPQFIRLAERPAPEATVPAGGAPYDFSWRWGVENDPGHQGYHGLKERVHDEFLIVGRSRQTMTGSAYEADRGAYFWTTIAAPHPMKVVARTGALKPAAVWLNGAPVKGRDLELKAGANPLVLYYDKPGRTYFVAKDESGDAVAAETISAFTESLWYRHPHGPPRLEPAADGPAALAVAPLAMRWWNDASVLPLDVRPHEKTPVGWYRFVSPPGLRAFTVAPRGKVQAWVNDKPLAGKSAFTLPEPAPEPVTVVLRIEQERGCYGGAAIPEPIRLDCGPGRMELGDWSKNDGLLSYSGGAWYRKSVVLPAARKLTLDLGNVAASAEVRVNGKLAGIRVSPPWTVDITPLARPGENRIEILVCNTLANHYSTIPTRYRGSPTSGLLGPVTIRYVPKPLDVKDNRGR